MTNKTYSKISFRDGNMSVQCGSSMNFKDEQYEKLLSEFSDNFTQMSERFEFEESNTCAVLTFANGDIKNKGSYMTYPNSDYKFKKVLARTVYIIDGNVYDEEFGWFISLSEFIKILRLYNNNLVSISKMCKGNLFGEAADVFREVDKIA